MSVCKVARLDQLFLLSLSSVVIDPLFDPLRYMCKWPVARTPWTARCEVYIIYLSHIFLHGFRQIWILRQYRSRCSFYDFRLLWPWCRSKFIEETFDSGYCVLGKYGGRHVGDGIFVEGNAKIQGKRYLQIWRFSMLECGRGTDIPSRKKPLCAVTSPR